MAGDSVRGYNGDNILATLAELNQCGGVALDVSGNIYIAEAGNNRIRKVSSDFSTEVKGDLPFNIKTYPNPFTNKLSIELGDEPADITMFDALGNVVKQTTSVGHTVLSMVNVSSGVYFLRVTSKNKSPVIIKVVAE